VESHPRRGGAERRRKAVSETRLSRGKQTAGRSRGMGSRFEVGVRACAACAPWGGRRMGLFLFFKTSCECTLRGACSSPLLAQLRACKTLAALDAWVQDELATATRDAADDDDEAAAARRGSAEGAPPPAEADAAAGRAAATGGERPFERSVARARATLAAAASVRRRPSFSQRGAATLRVWAAFFSSPAPATFHSQTSVLITC
jgi:hypothetical protein